MRRLSPHVSSLVSAIAFFASVLAGPSGAAGPDPGAPPAPIAAPASGAVSASSPARSSARSSSPWASVVDAAHRGLWSGGDRWHGRATDEDTTQACLNALKHGADTCELDVQETRDHGLAVIHDPTLDRTTDCRGAVAARTLAADELCRTEHGEHVPSLASFVRAVHRDYPERRLVIESKGYPSETYLRAMMHWVRWFGASHVRLESFHARNLDRLRQLDPSVPLYYIDGDTTHPPTPSWVARHGFRGAIIPFVALVHALHANPSYVAAYRDRGLRLMPWNVNTRAEMDRTIAAGVTDILTNRSDVLARVKRAHLS